MTKKEMNELADMIVDKLLTTYIKDQVKWYTTTTENWFPGFNNKKSNKTESEADLLGELAKLMTKLSYHQEREEYEKCAELKKKIDKLNEKLGNK